MFFAYILPTNIFVITTMGSDIMEKEKWSSFTRIQIAALLAYYIILLIVGLVLNFVMIKMNVTSIKVSSNMLYYLFMGGLGFEIVGNSIYYLRRLYISCINSKITISSDVAKEKKIGYMVYLFTRPLFSLAFFYVGLVLFYIIINSMLTPNGSYNITIIYWFALVSLVIGFSTGHILDKLLKKTANMLGKFLN